MRYWGIHRKHRDSKEGSHASSSSDQRAEHPTTRPRRTQPRDALGRFRKAGRDDDFAIRAGGDQPAQRAPAKQAYRWRDFELDDDLPRTPARPPDAPGAPERPGPPDGRRHCGPLEGILYRQWDGDLGPPTPEVVRAIDSLAALPEPLKELLARGLDGIYVGPGGVP